MGKCGCPGCLVLAGRHRVWGKGWRARAATALQAGPSGAPGKPKLGALAYMHRGEWWRVRKQRWDPKPWTLLSPGSTRSGACSDQASPRTPVRTHRVSPHPGAFPEGGGSPAWAVTKPQVLHGL